MILMLQQILSFAETVLIEHLACSLLCHRCCNMLVERRITDVNRWHRCTSFCLNSLGHCDSLLHCCTSLDIPDLIQHVRAIIARLSHALIEVI